MRQAGHDVQQTLITELVNSSLEDKLWAVEKENAKFGNVRKITTMSKNMRQVILYMDEDDYWIVECPSLPGCVSQGSTKEEALNNIKEAIHGYITALEEDGLPVPIERFEAITVLV